MSVSEFEFEVELVAGASEVDVIEAGGREL